MSDAGRTAAEAVSAIVRIAVIALAIVGALSLFGVGLGPRQSQGDPDAPAPSAAPVSSDRVIAGITRVHADLAGRIEDLDRSLQDRDAAALRRHDLVLAELRRGPDVSPGAEPAGAEAPK